MRALLGAGILPSGVQCRTADCHERLGPGVDGLQEEEECVEVGGAVGGADLAVGCLQRFGPSLANPPWHQGPGAPHSKLSQCRAEMFILLPPPHRAVTMLNFKI